MVPPRARALGLPCARVWRLGAHQEGLFFDFFKEFNELVLVHGRRRRLG